MPTLTSFAEPAAMTVQLHGIVDLDDDQLFELCRRNRGLRIERTAAGDLIFMTPAGARTSHRNVQITAQLQEWAESDDTGAAFDSSAGFTLPNGAMRSPDAAWVERTRLHELTDRERERFLPLCPAFVIELRSPSDRLATLQAKMQEYMDQGALLGWLIDPIDHRVHVYRPGVQVEVLEEPASVAADPQLPGFVLKLTKVWNLDW